MKDKYKSAYAKKRATKRKSAPKRKTTAPKKSNVKKAVVVPDRVRAAPGYLSTSLWVATNKPAPSIKAMKAVGLSSVYTDNISNISGSAVGHHGAFQLAHMPKFDIQGIDTALAGQEVNRSGPRRFVLESYYSETSITNNTTGSQEVELYDLVTKQDLPFIKSFVIGTNTYLVGANPIAYMVEGIAAAQAAATGSVVQTALLVGTNPFDSPFFKDHFKVVKRTIIQMSPGASHRHTVSLKPNRLCKEEDYGFAPGTPTPSGSIIATAGFQCFTMGIIRPYGAVDITATPNIPHCPRGSVVTVQSMRYKYTEVVGLQSNLRYNTQITTPPSNADVFAYVNPLTGATGSVGAYS